MAERLNNLLFHANRAREMAMEGAGVVPKVDRTIHGRAWKFSRGSYPVIGGTLVYVRERHCFCFCFCFESPSASVSLHFMIISSRYIPCSPRLCFFSRHILSAFPCCIWFLGLLRIFPYHIFPYYIFLEHPPSALCSFSMHLSASPFCISSLHLFRASLHTSFLYFSFTSLLQIFPLHLTPASPTCI